MCCNKKKQLLFGNIAFTADEYSRLHSSVPFAKRTHPTDCQWNYFTTFTTQTNVRWHICWGITDHKAISYFLISLFGSMSSPYRSLSCIHGPSHYIRISAHVHHFVKAATKSQWKIKRKKEEKMLYEPGVNAMQCNGFLLGCAICKRNIHHGRNCCC